MSFKRYNFRNVFLTLLITPPVKDNTTNLALRGLDKVKVHLQLKL